MTDPSSCSVYVYKVSRAGVSLAFVIAVSISVCLVLTASLWVDMLLGIAVDFSVFLVMYQSVLDSIPATCCFKVLINFVFNPSTFTSPTDLSLGKSPSSLSCWDQVVSACA